MDESAIPDAQSLLDWLDLAEDLIPSSTLSILPENRDAFVVQFGICIQAIRFGGAYAALWRIGRNREAVPLGRAALEHAITAQWIFHRDGVALMHAHARRKSHEFFTFMAEYLGDDELAAEAAVLGEHRPGMPNFWRHVLGDLDYGGMLASSYRQMSQVTHVDGATIAAFAEFDGTNYNFVGRPEDPHATVNLYITANAVMLAAWVLGQLLESPDIKPMLDDIAQRLRLAQTAYDPDLGPTESTAGK